MSSRTSKTKNPMLKAILEPRFIIHDEVEQTAKAAIETLRTLSHAGDLPTFAAFATVLPLAGEIRYLDQESLDAVTALAADLGPTLYARGELPRWSICLGRDITTQLFAWVECDDIAFDLSRVRSGTILINGELPVLRHEIFVSTSEVFRGAEQIQSFARFPFPADASGNDRWVDAVIEASADKAKGAS